MSIDNDDALLDALGRGDPPPPGDDVAMLLAAWRDDIADVSPAHLRPASVVPAPRPRRDPKLRPTSATAPVRPGGRKRRLFHPLITAIAAALLVFGGLAVASMTAEPGGPLWPLARIIWSDKTDSKLAEQEAGRLLEQAREALAGNRSQEAAELVARARPVIGRITDAEAKRKLEQEATELLAQVVKAPTVASPSAGSTPPGASPSPSQTGLPPILPSLLPSLPPPLPSLPLPTLPLSD